MGSLNGKVVAITGASSGIGEATALACAREGAKVALCARRRERLEGVAERIAAGGGEPLVEARDISVEGEATAFVYNTHKHFGRLDVLVNNAGVMLLGGVEGADTAEWRRMIAVNVYGALYCTHAALPLLRQAEAGQVVNVSSVAGRFARAGSAVYNLTKFGLGAFSEALRQEVAPDGIRVTLIEPGVVKTELLDHNRPEVRNSFARRFGDLEPLTAEEVADAILYVISRPPNVAINELLIRPTRQVR